MSVLMFHVALKFHDFFFHEKFLHQIFMKTFMNNFMKLFISSW
jgi:hypothetical protein